MECRHGHNSEQRLAAQGAHLLSKLCRRHGRPGHGRRRWQGSSLGSLGGLGSSGLLHSRLLRRLCSDLGLCQLCQLGWGHELALVAGQRGIHDILEGWVRLCAHGSCLPCPDLLLHHTGKRQLEQFRMICQMGACWMRSPDHIKKLSFPAILWSDGP